MTKYQLKNFCIYDNTKIATSKINLKEYISTDNILPNKEGYVIANSIPNQKKVNYALKGNILISNIRPYFKKIVYADKNMGVSNDVLNIKVIDDKKLDSKYLFYYLSQDEFFEFVMAGAKGTKMPRGDKLQIMQYEINIPTLNNQRKIISILDNISYKINLNKKINDNLLEVINSIYTDKFTEIQEIKRADEIANITIGKTPPRSKKECFSTNEEDIKWVSISDMGKSGTYIFNTNEKLTNKAINDYNVKIVPKDTILMSFKLTIGRITITTEDMATNEAIAQFNLKDNNLKYYLYNYLKNFNYKTLGSTSSIATAINSKIVKAMPIEIPFQAKLEEYNKLVIPMFKIIKENEIQNKTLEQLRETLLPKLMNGEIDLDKIEI